MKLLSFLGLYPKNWGKMIHWNDVPLISHTYHICKNGKLSAIHFIVALFLNCADKVQQSMKTTWQMFYYLLGPSPRNKWTTINWNVVLTIFHPWCRVCYVWKIVRTLFQWIEMIFWQCIIVPRLRVEGPKNDQNIMHPGSQSLM